MGRHDRLLLGEVQLCGVVALPGTPTPVTGRQLLLLAVLLVRGEQGIRRDELVEILWSDRLPRDPGKALNPLLSRLRRVAGDVEGRGVVRLVPATPVVVDVLQAGAAVREADTLLDREPAAAAGRAEQAARLLDGEFLPAFSDPWTLAERERLASLRAEALTIVVAAGLRLGGPWLARAERAASTLVEQAPLQERAVGLLMDVLAARGEEAAALAAYQHLRKRLRDELGGFPGRRLREAHATLLRAAPDADDGRTTRELPAGVTRARSTVLVGRKREQNLLAEALAPRPGAGVTLAVLHGPGAIGKTRLAAEAAADRHAAGATVLFAHAEDRASAAFAPLVAALRPLVLHGDADRLGESLGALAADLAALLPDLLRRLPVPPAPPDADPGHTALPPVRGREGTDRERGLRGRHAPGHRRRRPPGPLEHGTARPHCPKRASPGTRGPRDQPHMAVRGAGARGGARRGGRRRRPRPGRARPPRRPDRRARPSGHGGAAPG